MTNRNCNSPIVEMGKGRIRMHGAILLGRKSLLVREIKRTLIIKDIRKPLFQRKGSMINLKKLKYPKCPKTPERTILRIRRRKYKEISPFKGIISCSRREEVDKEEIRSLIDIYYIRILLYHKII